MSLNFPASPSVNQIYTVGDSSWKWNGVAWIAISEQESTGPVYIGSLPPSSPQTGDLWWNSDNGELFLRYEDTDGAQWVSAVVPPPIATLSSAAVVNALLSALDEYSSIAGAQAAGVPVGGLFKISGFTGADAIRVVVP